MNNEQIQLTKKEAIRAIKTCIDPELGLDLWTLGLIYTIEIQNNNIAVEMTLTSPMCPFSGELSDIVKTALQKAGFKQVTITIVFQPLWKPSQEVKEMLGIM